MTYLSESKTQTMCRVFHINVFTQQAYSGNIATVVWQNNDLSNNTMQILAREFNTPETIFIKLDERNKDELFLRFFTPTQEVPSCGHGTIAAAHVANTLHKTPLEDLTFKTATKNTQIYQDQQKVLNQQATKENIPTYRFKVPIPKLERIVEISQDLVSVFNNVNLINAYIVSTGAGKSRLLLHCKNKDELLALTPNFNQLLLSLEPLDVFSVFVFSIDNNNYSKISARMFAPAIGINEDPVNGNSSVALSCVIFSICKSKGIKCPNNFEVEQGESIGRMGKVIVHLQYNVDSLLNVEMAGQALDLYNYKLTKLPMTEHLNNTI